jgi:hypothetical protein
MRRAVCLLALVACSDGGGEVFDRQASADSDPLLHDRAFYVEVAESAGIDPQRTFVVGLRGVARDGTHHEVRSRQRFDDVVAVVTPTSVLELAASTHPWFARSSAPPDVAHDGIGDVGILRPGTYHAVARPPSRDLGGAPTFHVLTSAGQEGLPGWRDTNHDGVYDEGERSRSEERGDLLTAILFHRGGGGAPPPIGCQVLSRADLERFVEALGGRDADFDYVLIDAP